MALSLDPAILPYGSRGLGLTPAANPGLASAARPRPSASGAVSRLSLVTLAEAVRRPAWRAARGAARRPTDCGGIARAACLFVSLCVLHLHRFLLDSYLPKEPITVSNELPKDIVEELPFS